MRLVFAGTPQAAVASLEALLRSRHEVAAVITRPDAPAGRGRRVTQSPVAARARSEGIEVLQPARLRDPAFLGRLRELAPDCCAVTAYGALIPQEALDIPPHGWVNLHFSLLPGGRPARPARGLRSRPARRDAGRYRGRRGRRAGAAARAGEPRPEADRRGRQGPLGRARRGGGPADPGLHAGAGRVDHAGRDADKARAAGPARSGGRPGLRTGPAVARRDVGYPGWRLRRDRNLAGPAWPGAAGGQAGDARAGLGPRAAP